MPPLARIGSICLLVTLAACANVSEPAADTAACKIDRVAETPVRIVAGGMLVPGRINGNAVQMVLDTGATGSLLDNAEARRLSLPADPHRRTTVVGVGGETLTQNTLIQSFEIGGQEWQTMSIATGHLPQKFNESPPVAGLLGADRLSSFDVELDIPHGRMTLWHVAHCAGDFVGWAEPHYVVPLMRHNPNRMVAPVDIDGHRIVALIDWGANTTTLTSQVAAELGVTPAMLAGDRLSTSRGVDQTQKQVRLHHFDEVRIGGETFHHLGLFVSDLHLQEAGMLLGADYMRTRRIWLSYATRQIFVVPPKAAAP
jgi:predicted aspartyl protease